MLFSTRQGFLTRKAPSGGGPSNSIFLLQANANDTFSDTGGNALSISKTGTVNYSSSIPFGSSSLKSADFGTGSGYLAPANNSIFAFGTGDWTVELYFYLTAYATSNGLTPFFDNDSTASGARNNSVIIYLHYTGQLRVFHNGGDIVTSGSNTFGLNTWHHLAVVRSGGTTYIYQNGTNVGSNTHNWYGSGLTTNAGYIGFVSNVSGATSQFGITGLVSNFRVTKGTAVYTGNFTPSATDLTNY